MTVSGRALKRANRRVTADLNDFLTFPAGGDLDGPFRSNVREFLDRHARTPTQPSILSPPLALVTSRVAFRIGDLACAGEEMPANSIVELSVVEEDVQRSRRKVYCEQCQTVGWSGHPVCVKRYHFIMRNDYNFSSSNHRICPQCEMMIPLSDMRCTSCNNELTPDDIVDWEYRQLDNSTHLLHGVVHTNGYGHLLRVNGLEGGSKFLTGSDIMNFWDRLCKMLRVRKITVMDLSKKYGLEYRLIHAVTTGRCWYGKWGYEFGVGSFGITAEAYHKAVEILSDVPLSLFFTHARSPRTQLQDTISLYWSISELPLVTVGDLFRYVLGLLHDVAMSTTVDYSAKEPSVASGVLSVWTNEDIVQAENAIVKVLKAVGGSQWVTRRALMGATCRSVSLDLLDYCLKGLGGKYFDPDMVVEVRFSWDAHSLEYRLEPASNHSFESCTPSVDHLLNDIKFLYSALLNPATMQSYKPLITREAVSSAKKVLDCKQFIKHYDQQQMPKEQANPFALQMWCHVELINQPKDFTAPPPELLILPLSATIAGLKSQASIAFSEIYILFQRFQAEQLLDYHHLDESTNIQLLLGLSGTVRVKGSCSGEVRRLWNFRMERGVESWTVNCICGAKDDDGERMMACDVCEVWSHPRCSGIKDNEDPPEFICALCAAQDVRDVGFVGGRCKEIAPSIIKSEDFGHSIVV